MSKLMYSIKSLLILILFSTVLVFTSCGDEEEPEPMDCNGQLLLGGSAVVNGETHAFAVAQLIITTGFEGDQYTFQFLVFDNDCLESKSINMSIEIESEADLNGTYPIVDFFDADLDEAHGSYVTQTYEPVNQVFSEVSSGSFKVTKTGNSSYNFDINANLLGGGNTTWVFSREF